MRNAVARFHRPGDATDAPTASGFGLPQDLLLESRRRIRLVALLVLLGSGADTVIMLVGLVAWLTGRTPAPSLTAAIPLVGNVLTVTAAAGMAVAAGSRRIGSAALLRLALGFEVFLCLLLSLSNPASVFEETGALPHLTWVTPLIILFPLIVPCPPRRTVVTAILAAATRPLAIFVLSATGRIEATAGDAFSSLFNPAIAVVIAYFGSRVVYGLGVQVADARRMGSYRLERLLGRGGMGEVWVARHRMLARPAAVKLIRADISAPGSSAGEAALGRFEREAQTTAQLRSPHTVGLYDFGVADDGTFYIVMELLDGLDLESMVRRHGPVPAGRVVRILRQACHSLSEAHGAGLIHRDIKPANIFLCRYGLDLDFVKVLDFGLVKARADADDTATLTAEGVISGTPAYMAPEQARGADRADARSDLYALGCVAYWLLTGQRVFEGDTPLEVLLHHAQTAPVPPSRRTEIDVPGDLERIVLACLEKDPAARPQSAAELDALLAACTTGDGWTDERARRWWDAHRPETVASEHDRTA